MALSLIDLLDLPPDQRADKNILLNIPSLRRKCDLFYYLDDKEAYRMLQHCRIKRFSPDAAVDEAADGLCILLKGKISLCHKMFLQLSTEDKDGEGDAQNETEKKEGDEKKDGKEKTPEKTPEKIKTPGPEDRRQSVLDQVTALLEERRNSLDAENRERRATVQANLADKDQGIVYIIQEKPTRTALYGKPVIQYTDNSYFGGPYMTHQKNAGKHEQYTYVADVNSTIITIPLSLQTSIVNTHYLNNIKNKESFMQEHHITRNLTKPLQSALLHEIVENHFSHGNVLMKKGVPAKTVYLIKSGYARIYLDIKVPKARLSEAVQHLPSTKMQQRLKTLKFDVVDVGPGEFIGGLEQLCGQATYVFTVVATCEIVAYNMRAEHFRDILLKANSKTLQVFTDNMQDRYRLRRQMADFSLCPEIAKVIARLMGEENREEATEAHMDALKSDLTMNKRFSPQYMMQERQAVSSERQSLRAPNRGPFADRVRKRMVELGFKSRRGT